MKTKERFLYNFTVEWYNKYASVQKASSGNRITQMTLFSKAWAMRSIHLGSGRTLSGLSYDNIYDDEA